MLNYSRHYRAINGRQVAVEEKRGVGFSRLAWLHLPLPSMLTWTLCSCNVWVKASLVN